MASYLASKAFWIGAGERAVKTVAQSALALLTTDAVVNAFHIGWSTLAGVSLGAGLLSVLTSLATGKAVAKTTNED